MVIQAANMHSLHAHRLLTAQLDVDEHLEILDKRPGRCRLVLVQDKHGDSNVMVQRPLLCGVDDQTARINPLYARPLGSLCPLDLGVTQGIRRLMPCVTRCTTTTVHLDFQSKTLTARTYVHISFLQRYFQLVSLSLLRCRGEHRARTIISAPVCYHIGHVPRDILFD